MARTIGLSFSTFYDHVAKKELRFPKCQVCGRFHWYPMKVCPHCRSSLISWAHVKGPARLYSWTRVEHGFDPEWNGVPYIVALVEFDDAPGVRYVTNIVEAESAYLRIGMELKPLFPSAGTHPVHFTPKVAAPKRKVS